MECPIAIAAVSGRPAHRIKRSPGHRCWLSLSFCCLFYCLSLLFTVILLSSQSSASFGNLKKLKDMLDLNLITQVCLRRLSSARVRGYCAICWIARARRHAAQPNDDLC